MGDRRIRVGVLGAGSWAVTNHIPILAARSDVELVVACRKGVDELHAVQERFGFAHVTEDAVEATDYGLDAVVVAGPTASHYEHVRLALDAGAHVLCEKPFTIHPSEAWDLVDRAQRSERHLVIAFGWNYQPILREAKKLLDEVGIGNLEHAMVAMASAVRELLRNTDAIAHSSFEAASDDLTPDPRTWTDPALSGGGYGQAQLSHALGMLLWLTGERGEQVFALMNAPGAPVDMYDAVGVRFMSGATCSMSGASMPRSAKLVDADPYPRHQMQVRLFGSEGQLILDLERELLWVHRDDGTDIRVPMSNEAGRYRCDGPPNALIDLALGTQDTSASPGELGARTVEVLSAAYQSARTGAMARCAPTTNATTA